MNDWKCRNCGFRFVPTFWVSVGGNTLVGQCPKCESNATHEITDSENAKNVQYGVPKTTDGVLGGKIRLDE